MVDDSGKDERVDWIALARYLAGESPPGERAELEDLLRRDPALQELVHVLQRTGYAHHRPPTAPDIEDSWGRMKRRLGKPSEFPASTDSPSKQERMLRLYAPASAQPPGSPRRDSGRSADPRPARARPRRPARKFRKHAWATSAALLVLVAGFTAFVLSRMPTHTGDPEQTVVQMREVATASAQRATFSLGDGTRIILNAESRLRVPDVFEENVREVYLEGEGLFEVAHDEERPFVVHARAGRIEVLGTTFAVRSYPEDEALQVVVADGSVVVSRAEESGGRRIALRPGERALLSDDGTLLSDVVDVWKYTSWVEGRLVFDQTPLHEIAETLERWYDVDVRIRDERLPDVTLSADLKGKYLVDVVRALSMTADFRYELDDDQLVLLE